MQERGKRGIPDKNPPTSGIVRHESPMQKSGNRTRSRLVGRRGENLGRRSRQHHGMTRALPLRVMEIAGDGDMPLSPQGQVVCAIAIKQTALWLDYSPPNIDEPSSIPGGVAPGFSHVGIVPDDAAGQLVFSEMSRFPRPCTPALLHIHLVSSSSALILTAAQISSPTTHYKCLVGCTRDQDVVGSTSKGVCSQGPSSCALLVTPPVRRNDLDSWLRGTQRYILRFAVLCGTILFPLGFGACLQPSGGISPGYDRSSPDNSRKCPKGDEVEICNGSLRFTSPANRLTTRGSKETRRHDVAWLSWKHLTPHHAAVEEWNSAGMKGREKREGRRENPPTSGIPRPCIPALLHTHLTSSSLALETQMLMSSPVLSTPLVPLKGNVQGN
ncbi:hypothetical protein PR048_029040 [Dryococelus australis]|uniref:Uncharacterized protein n=1 Tax=Dryococelus australis TaxID=614101 RepID=A0ABQ9GFR9_9NEOP|nr:hypothetical protein PR048_029040 [Dryococelus australis]